MALTQLDYTAYRTLQRVLHDRLAEHQWEGREVHPRPVGWHDIGHALDEAVSALEAVGYRVVKA